MYAEMTIHNAFYCFFNQQMLINCPSFVLCLWVCWHNANRKSRK